MKDLDILEKEILKAIDRCSVFTIKEIIYVYKTCKSFDKTIMILKRALTYAISLDDSIKQCS